MVVLDFLRQGSCIVARPYPLLQISEEPGSSNQPALGRASAALGRASADE